MTLAPGAAQSYLPADPARGPRAWYDALSRQDGFQPDPAQHAAVEHLQRLHDELLDFKAYRQRPLVKTFGRRPPPRGLYFHGGVGRGKSLLMDSFFEHLPYRRKRRVHFHDFMREVHVALGRHKGQADPLKKVAAEICAHTRVLCFDEFHVSDIADAMILARLLEELFRGGVVLVATSNYPPDALYPNGLQRERFLPAIELLKQQLLVVNVDGGIDHRLRRLEQARTYLYPLDEAARRGMQEAFALACPRADGADAVTVSHRRIPVHAVGAGAVWFGFDELCGSARSQIDYLEIAQRWATVLVSDVPRMGKSHASEARRFTWLVDILYDHRVKLFLSAEAPADGLYLEGPSQHEFVKNEFARTVSRLREMQSAHYLSERPRAVQDQGRTTGPYSA